MISAIIPNYNHAKYLEQRIESVLNQSYPYFEVIILDDCSTDNSRELIEQYRRHTRVRHIIYNEKNSGSTFQQWKKGIELAKGEWIWIAESDDYADKEFLQTLSAYAVQSTRTALVYCKSLSVDEQNRPIHKRVFKDLRFSNVAAKTFDQDYCESGQKEFAEKLIYYCTIPNASAVLVKKNLLQKYIQDSISYKLVGDWLMWSNILSEADLCYVAQPLNYFRQHSNNVRTAVARTRLQEKEYIQLRKTFESIINRLSYDAAQKERLMKTNRHMLGIDLGYVAMYDVRNGMFGRGLYNLIRSSMYAGIQSEFVKGYAYWCREKVKEVRGRITK